MRSRELYPPLGEGLEQSPVELLDGLASFDNAIFDRIWILELAHLTDPSFGADLETEQLSMDPETIQGHFELIDSYRWALAVHTYPYRDRADIEEVRGTAAMALFEAVRSHDPEQQPDFLLHLSGMLSSTMAKEYGKPAVPNVPSAAEFDDFVARHHLINLPPTPDERLPEHLAEGEIVLVMEAGQLVPGVVREITDREHEAPFVLNHIPAEELPEMQARLERAYAQLKAEGSRITLGDPAAGPDEVADFEARVNLQEDDKIPPVELLHALGRAPMWLYARYPQMQANPDSGPSTTLVATDANPKGTVVEVNQAGLIPAAAWKLIASKPLYREVYLDRGTGDAEQRATLEQAILARKQADATIKPPQINKGSKRARPSNQRVNKARLSPFID
jgi:hypothetical protein